MKPIAIFYATREGQTQRIAEYIGAAFQARGVAAVVRSVATKVSPDWKNYEGVVVAASVHAGGHEPEMVKFVKRYRSELEALPTAFLSTTLSQAGVQRTNATAEERARFAADVQKMVDGFLQITAWRPTRIQPVAGALVYSKYNFFIRYVMKRIARKAGGDTDTSRDYEYTDWAALRRFVDEFSNDVFSASCARRVG